MNEKKFITRIVILIAIGLMFVAYGNYLTGTVRNETIRSAELIKVADMVKNTYTIMNNTHRVMLSGVTLFFCLITKA